MVSMWFQCGFNVVLGGFKVVSMLFHGSFNVISDICNTLYIICMTSVEIQKHRNINGDCFSSILHFLQFTVKDCSWVMVV